MLDLDFLIEELVRQPVIQQSMDLQDQTQNTNLSGNQIHSVSTKRQSSTCSKMQDYIIKKKSNPANFESLLKRQQETLQNRKRFEEENQPQYNYKPKILEYRLLNRKPIHLDQRQQQNRLELQESFTFKPQISEKSKILAQNRVSASEYAIHIAHKKIKLQQQLQKDQMSLKNQSILKINQSQVKSKAIECGLQYSQKLKQNDALHKDQVKMKEIADLQQCTFKPVIVGYGPFNEVAQYLKLNVQKK